MSAADPPVRLHLSNTEVIKRSIRRCRRGALPKDLKERLTNLCRARRDDTTTMQELLGGVAHTIRFS